MKAIILLTLLSVPANAGMTFGDRVRRSGDTMTGTLFAPKVHVGTTTTDTSGAVFFSSGLAVFQSTSTTGNILELYNSARSLRFNVQANGNATLSSLLSTSNGLVTTGVNGLRVTGANSPTNYIVNIASQNAVIASVFGVTNGGHVVSSGTTPSIVCNVGTPAMSADSNDMSGEYTGGALSVNCTLTFVNVWAKKPRCFCNDETNIVALQAITTTTTLKCSAVAATGTDLISYFCWGSP